MAGAAHAESYDPSDDERDLTDAGMPEGQAKAVARGHDRAHSRLVVVKDDVDKQYDAIGIRFDKIDNQFEYYKLRFENIDQRFDNVDQRLDNVDQRIDGIDKRIDGIDKKIDDLKEWMDRALKDLEEKIHLRLDAKMERGFNGILKVIIGATGVLLGALGAAVAVLLSQL